MAKPTYRKKRAGFSDAAILDRLPPHSIEAEQGVLGCVMLSPDCLADCISAGMKPGDFYDIRNQVTFTALLSLERTVNLYDIDPISIERELKRLKLFDDCGGRSYLLGLPDASPSAANIGSYIQIVLEKTTLRKLIQTATEVVSRAYEHEGEVDELADIVLRDFESICQPRSEKHEALTWNQLVEFDTDNDPNCVIGFRDGKTTRFLCRGQAAWLIGPSGAGKSSLHMAMAANFACGKDFCSISVNGKPLRVLVVQAENDTGDLAEMAQGISTEFKNNFNDAAIVAINKNISVVSVTGKIGLEFCHWLKKNIILHKADLVMIDPLLSFAGIDVSRQSDASMFCRVWLGPILQETGAVLISVHHTGKPNRDSKKAPSIYDLMYEGIGSSELVNWARAVLLLQPSEGSEGIFRLHLAKRGKRAWATHPNGEPTQVIYLRQALTGIHWEQIDPPEEPTTDSNATTHHRPSKIQEVAAMNLFSFCAGCPPHGEGLNEVAKRLEDWLAHEKMDVSIKTCKRAIPLLVANGKLTKGPDGKYRKGDQA